jgi:predicted MFS family arabinose efflux permease
LVVAIGSLVLAIHEGADDGWSALVAIAGLVALGGFIAHELRRPEPLLDIRAFRNRRLASGSTALLLLFAISAGVFVVLFPFLQAVLGWSALRSMLGLLPMIVVMMSASSLAAAVSARAGARATMLTGVATTATGLGLMAALVSVDGGYPSVLPGLILVGLGMGLTMPPSTEAITASLPPERQGVASALNDTTREVGSAIGIALLGAVLTAVYSDSMQAALTGFPARISAPAGEGIGRAFDVASQQQDESQAAALVDAARQAFVDGWAASIWVGAGVMCALLVFLALRTPRLPRSAHEDAQVSIAGEIVADAVGSGR